MFVDSHGLYKQPDKYNAAMTSDNKTTVIHVIKVDKCN